MGSKRRIIIAVAILVAAPLALLMAMGCLPEMTYQGVLTDTSGRPVPDGAYTMQFRLLDVSGLTPVAVFTQTSSVTVTNGIFNVVLGDYYGLTPLPVDKFSRPLALEIAVNGDVLAPTQALNGVPYAFSLAPGAVIYDPELSLTPGNPALTIQKESDGAALRLEGGELQSDQDSYLWVPASLGYPAMGSTVTIISYNDPGGVRLTRPAGAGWGYFGLPIQLPGVLYGQNVTLEEMTVYYQCNGTCGAANTRISATSLMRQIDPDSEETLVTDASSHYSTSANGDSYSLSPSYIVGSSASGIMAVRWSLYFNDGDDQIRITGVRVRLGHQ